MIPPLDNWGQAVWIQEARELQKEVLIYIDSCYIWSQVHTSTMAWWKALLGGGKSDRMEMS